MNTKLNPIELTQELIRFDTVNPPGNEDQICKYLQSILEAAGYECRQIEFAPRRMSLVAKIGSCSPAKPSICFTGHVDVVPLGARSWKFEPFAGLIDDGKLYGRGSSDMKSGVAAFVVAAVQAAKEAKQGGGVTMIITAGEETGCEGAFHLAASKEIVDFLGPAGCFVVAEPTANEPLLGHKGAYWLKATTEGVTAHGSMPERGDNAFYKLAKAALTLEQFTFDTPPHELMGQGTLNVGTAKSGLNINSVPDAAEMTLDIRTVAGQSHSHIYGCLCKALGPTVQLDTIIDIEGVFTPANDPWMEQVFEHCTKINGIRPVEKTVSYFTDASALKSAIGNPPTVILGPGQPEMAHQTDEFCYVDKIKDATQLFANLISDWQNT
ncbi:M20 family metallopeptidase [Polynucleobacter sp. AP-Jannik-300A-C4]|uniref:M20 family metallopeptidase n=1 Tax=Polynucleobacter sp. AP-Jannik-300A-C4 TaxID=2576928 RepID=UPI001BFD89CF|nr:M20 family metallopeptidase [Polynucleobacter sp. AP-Jannik-300A-C4]QWE23500.1 M20 family metallopeptidase [Polynucleobacter sp. AP-Jannik-300A-C4]